MLMFMSCDGKKVALLVLRRVGLCVGAKPNVPLVRLPKIVFKKCGAAKKIKKHWGGLSDGLLAVPFQYGLYVFGHLSKWFVFVLKFKFWSVGRLWNGRPTIGYNGLRIKVVAQP